MTPTEMRTKIEALQTVIDGWTCQRGNGRKDSCCSCRVCGVWRTCREMLVELRRF